jgi:membrane protein YdbS with pleckstrin-like domain
VEDGVADEHLAPSDDPPWRRLAPKAVLCRALGTLVGTVVVAGIATVIALVRSGESDRTRFYMRIAGGLAVFGILLALRAAAAARRFRYRVTATTAETLSGVLTRRVRVVPLGRIQHVDLESGPVDRLFGLSSVSAHTAAGDATVHVNGVRTPDATVLRDLLLRGRRHDGL